MKTETAPPTISEKQGRIWIITSIALCLRSSLSPNRYTAYKVSVFFLFFFSSTDQMQSKWRDLIVSSFIWHVNIHRAASATKLDVLHIFFCLIFLRLLYYSMASVLTCDNRTGSIRHFWMWRHLRTCMAVTNQHAEEMCIHVISTYL